MMMMMVYGLSGHPKYLCTRASHGGKLTGRASRYLFKSSVIAYCLFEKGGCLFIRVACDLFSMLTWHDVLGIQ